MAEYISKQDVIDYLNGYLHSLGEDADTLFNRGQRRALTNSIQDILAVKAAEVQPVKTSKWCPPLMGQGKCDTYCERCYGKIMRNSTGIFEETPFCPHCGARMDGDTE